MIKLKSAFKGFTLDPHDNFFIVCKSENETSEKIASIVEQAKFLPFISANRLNGMIVFTVCPYLPPSSFNPPDLHQPARRQADVFSAIIGQALEWKGAQGISINGQYFNDRRDFWAGFAKRCNVIPSLLYAFLNSRTESGDALELGCGYGAASRFLSQKGWNVLAVDNCPQALETLKGDQNIVPLEKKVEELDIGEKYDLILASNILEFTDPSQFPLLWKRIYNALKDDGVLIGSFKQIINDQETMKRSRELGNWHVRDVCDVTTLLEKYNIDICRCSYAHPDCEPMKIEFMAQKKTIRP